MMQPRNAKKKSDKDTKKKDKEKKQEVETAQLIESDEPLHMRFNSVPNVMLETRETSAFTSSKTGGLESFKDSDRFDHVNKRSFGGNKSYFEGVVEVAEEYDNVPNLGHSVKNTGSNSDTPTSSFASTNKKNKKQIKKQGPKIKSKQGEGDGACCSGNQCNIF